MKSLAIGIFIFLAVAVPPAGAIEVVVQPNGQTVGLGQTVAFDIAISGLGNGAPPSLGAFDLDLGFDPAILSFDSISFGDPILGSLLGPIVGSLNGFSNDPVTGLVNQFEISLELPATLDALQPDSFILTSLTFSSVGLGTSALDISNLILGDAVGAPLAADTIQNGSVTVAAAAVADSSQTAVLLGLGLIVLYAGRRRVVD
jgi:hypothetical protein